MSALQRFGLPLLLILICLGVLARKFDIAQGDLGRHLKNGELLLNGSQAEIDGVLHKNFYSYTAPDEPIINHHWLTGVVFYKIWQATSFTGLGLFYPLIVVAAVLITYWSASRLTDPLIAAALTSAPAVLISWRAEPRPEGFTYLFMAIFFAVLGEWFAGRMRSLWLWMLPPIMGLWINLHVAFVFGFFILGVFGLKVLLGEGASARFRILLAVAVACLAAAFLNPAGLNGILYPFTIFGKIDFAIGELQSLRTIFVNNRWKAPYTWYIVMLIGAIVLLVRRPFNVRTFPWPEALTMAAFIYLGLSQVRNIPFCLLALIPATASVVGPRKLATPVARYLTIGAIAAGVIFGAQMSFAFRKGGGFGIADNNLASAEFFKANRIKGPIFNDFDTGGFLIFNLYDPSGRAKVYADNRPEAYPAGFLTGSFTRALEEESVWHDEEAKHHFNTIVLSLADPITEGFILRRVRDDQWAPVFADEYALIFVRRTDENAVLISNHEIPRNRFR